MKAYSTLKDICIPHVGNEHKPYLFRELSISIILFVGIFLFILSFGRYYVVNKTGLGASVLSSVLIDLTNENRIVYNKYPLVRNERLDMAAKLKAEDMMREGYFAHYSPKGVTPWYWFKKAGYEYLHAGENLAINFTESQDVAKAWLASPTHKANLLNMNFKEIGVAALPGMYKGENTIFVVQMFGTPLIAKTNTPSPVAKKKDALSATEDTSATLATLEKKSGDVKGLETKVNDWETPVTEINENATSKNLLSSEALSQESLTRESYSKWYEKLLFAGSDYVTLTYKIIIGFLLISLLVMFFVEIRKQHWRHLSYGLLTIIILATLTYINTVFAMGLSL